MLPYPFEIFTWEDGFFFLYPFSFDRVLENFRGFFSNKKGCLYSFGRVAAVWRSILKRVCRLKIPKLIRKIEWLPRKFCRKVQKVIFWHVFSEGIRFNLENFEYFFVTDVSIRERNKWSEFWVPQSRTWKTTLYVFSVSIIRHGRRNFGKFHAYFRKILEKLRENVIENLKKCFENF